MGVLTDPHFWGSSVNVVAMTHAWWGPESQVSSQLRWVMAPLPPPDHVAVGTDAHQVRGQRRRWPRFPKCTTVPSLPAD